MFYSFPIFRTKSCQHSNEHSIIKPKKQKPEMTAVVRRILSVHIT